AAWVGQKKNHIHPCHCVLQAIWAAVQPLPPSASELHCRMACWGEGDDLGAASLQAAFKLHVCGKHAISTKVQTTDYQYQCLGSDGQVCANWEPPGRRLAG